MTGRAPAALPTVIGCWAYTRERGWHLGTVDLRLVDDADREAGRPTPRPAAAAPTARRAWSRNASCGTSAGYQRHRRNGETPCGFCRTARTVDQRERRARQRGASS